MSDCTDAWRAVRDGRDAYDAARADRNAARDALVEARRAARIATEDAWCRYVETRVASEEARRAYMALCRQYEDACHAAAKDKE
uniref:Uncharacterized protein n=1 Tax=viral metagenome TaxID=1070528 RepID=A0A6M3J5U2_9ZZZZ